MNTILNPDLYHGASKNRNFFEGWYFKLVSKDNNHSYAFIPGISYGTTSKNNHSFIQILDGYKKGFKYIKKDVSSFSWSTSPFNVTIEQNSFSLSGLNLNILQKDLAITGSIKFTNIKKWKDSLINPGSMGFYNYLSFMECYSQVCALDGDISGGLYINEDYVDFNNGKVYIEKNWGKSFPLEWLWVQSNSFEDGRATLTCSLGEIPFPIKNFRGFLIAVTVDDTFYKFTTINRSKLTLSLLNNSVEFTVSNGKFTLFVKTISNADDFILCYGPKNGEMSPYVKESLLGTVQLKLINNKTSEVVYEGLGHNTGIEYGGKLMA